MQKGLNVQNNQNFPKFLKFSEGPTKFALPFLPPRLRPNFVGTTQDDADGATYITYKEQVLSFPMVGSILLGNYPELIRN